MTKMIEIEEAEYDNLIEEIETAHEKLNQYGVGKQHWSLAGRIDALVIIMLPNLRIKISEQTKEIEKYL